MRLKKTAALYRRVGTESGLPRAMSRSDSETTSRASSHSQRRQADVGGGQSHPLVESRAREAGAHRRHGNPDAGVPPVRPAAEADQPALARAVGGERDEPRDRRDVCHATALPLEHRPQRGVSQTHRHFDEQTQRSCLVLDVVALELHRHTETRVVDEHVDRAIRVGQSSHDPLELPLDQEIRDEHLDIHPEPIAQRRRGFARAQPSPVRRERGRCRARRAVARTRRPGRSSHP